MKNLRYIALSGNVIYILWIIWNGIDEGSRNVGKIEIITLSGLLVLLCINSILLWKKD